MGVVDLADHRPLTFNFQQIEEIGEAKAGNVIGVDTGAGSCADDVNVHDYALGLRGGTKCVVDGVEQALNRAAGQLRLSINTENGGLIAERWLHQAAFCLFAALIVLIQDIDNSLVFLYVGRFTHGCIPVLVGQGLNKAAATGHIEIQVS